MIVAKFGGTSLASAERFCHAANLIRQDPNRRYVVVSAPGKRDDSDIKITDQLLRYSETGDDADIGCVEARFREIAEELEIGLDISKEFDEIRHASHRREYLASRGEYFSAKLMAAFLGWPFVDAAECVFFNEYGQVDLIKTQHALFEALRKLPHAVIPGFYGVMPNGEIHTFARGGSDITGALVAGAMDAQIYENWTDVDGMLVTDPRIVPQAAPLHAITYRELRELAYRGASVLHEDSVVPVRRSGIPIHICNTFRPQAPGSWIVKEAKETPAPITGIAGRRNYSTIQIERENTNSMVGYVRRILSCLEQLGIPFEHLATGLGSVCLVVPTQALEAHRAQLQEAIFHAIHPDSLVISDGLAMIAVVGRGMVGRPDVRARVFDALCSADISARVIDQGATEMNLVIGVDEDRYEDAVRAIHKEFFEV